MRALLLGLVLLCACGPAPLLPDAGAPDAAEVPGSGPAPDAGPPPMEDAGRDAGTPDAGPPVPCETESELNARMGPPAQTCTYPTKGYATVDIWALDGGGFICAWRPKAPDTCKRLEGCLLPQPGEGFCQ